MEDSLANYFQQTSEYTVTYFVDVSLHLNYDFPRRYKEVTSMWEKHINKEAETKTAMPLMMVVHL